MMPFRSGPTSRPPPIVWQLLHFCWKMVCPCAASAGIAPPGFEGAGWAAPAAGFSG